ncbi:VanZ family protein [Nocardioides zeae]|uniref:VanZ family protein n=1 Tax=Nocardioides imazamoxiresistens TaxID=3231893 RepID=A0ABU3PQH2_9ACTN|nr:VanZ family protein [Nocardioides zeae]MDT9591481.1 VanZ family protein [Nocardioides zeae]
MITTVLVQHPWLTTVALVASVVVGPVVGYCLVGRRRLATWLALISLLPVVALTFSPTGRDLAVGCAVEWDFPTLGAVELMANVVLFVPPTLLLGVALRRPLVVLVGASATAALIELLQAVATPLGRSCSTNDWLSNTLGAALGVAIAGVAIALHRVRTNPPRPRDDETSPGGGCSRRPSRSARERSDRLTLLPTPDVEPLRR